MAETTSTTPAPIVIDGRALQPPEPMELTMAALETLPADGEVHLLLHCEPAPLFNILRRAGYIWQSRWDQDVCRNVIRHEYPCGEGA
jgi:hypothetical protein